MYRCATNSIKFIVSYIPLGDSTIAKLKFIKAYQIKSQNVKVPPYLHLTDDLYKYQYKCIKHCSIRDADATADVLHYALECYTYCDAVLIFVISCGSLYY